MPTPLLRRRLPPPATSGRDRVVAVAGSFPPRRKGVTQTTRLKEQTYLPLAFHWRHPDNPLPLRSVRLPASARKRTLGLEAPPWVATGPVDLPFDFSGRVRALCADIVRHCPELRHIDVSRLLFGMTQARSNRRHGLQARVTPMRFGQGRLTHRRGAKHYQVQRYFVEGLEMLYLVTFCLPRFLDQDFDDKFITLFHELYHISPRFDGDLRRHSGRCSLHTQSKRLYDNRMAHLARVYLS